MNSGGRAAEDGWALHRSHPVDWEHPPGEVLPWLEAAAAVGTFATGAQELYLSRVDLPAHPEDAGRRERTEAALARVRALADADAPLAWAALGEVQGLVLGLPGPAPLRRGPAYAHGGRVCYGWSVGLADELRARWGQEVADPVVEGVRRYLELIHGHPFEDGNARAARLALEHALRRGGRATPPLEPFVRLPKPAGDVRRAWQLVRLLCRGTLRAAGICPGSVEAP